MKTVMFSITYARDTIMALARERRGAVAVFLAVAVIPLVAFLGLATDTARGYLVKSRLTQALDAAALAGGRAVFDPDRDAQIQMFFDVNFPTGFMGATASGPVINVTADGEVITLSANATVPTTFMRLLGFDQMPVTARTVVRRAVRGMELVLVMDNTGSMRSGGKIDAMKDAARDLVDILYGTRETVPDFWVGLVPFTAMVNMGPTRAAWLAGYNAAAYAPTAWKGCVEARAAPFDETDDTPAVAPWTAAFWASTLGVYPGAGDNDWDGTNIDETNGAQNDGLGPNLGCGPAITPLVAEKTTVVAAVDEMLPWHRGGTMANLGLVWAWRILSPQWRGLWGGTTPPELPLDYDTPLMDKVVIILTDGENQWYDWPGGLPGKPDAGTYPDADYTAYGRLSEGRLGTTSNSTATTIINTRMSAACEAMKAEGIIIYTITFQLGSAATQLMFQNCATSLAHYFNSPTNGDLAAAFATIGSQLSNLRLAE